VTDAERCHARRELADLYAGNPSMAWGVQQTELERAWWREARLEAEIDRLEALSRRCALSAPRRVCEVWRCGAR